MIRARGSGPNEHGDQSGDELLQVAIGLRILGCFCAERPTLTAKEISELLDLPEKDVARLAVRLASFCYLEADMSSGVGAWTLMPDAW